ncbi:MAG: TIGR02099 family protein [Burkholderiales bacterium]|nr:TIGR02099 family protein [Burkholderiales bacterium]
MDRERAMQNLPAVPGWRRFARSVFGLGEALAWTAFFAAALGIVALRYAVLPNIERYRPAIEAALSKGLAAKVTIGRIEAGWDGLQPDLDLADVRIFDRQGRVALSLPMVSLTVSWWSVPAAQLRLHALEITGADLDIRRTAAGSLVVGGMELAASADGGGAADWILAQRRIVIAESRVRWNDDRRGAPELALSNIRAVLQNAGQRRRLGVTADPPRELASRLDVRADLTGESLERLAGWRGQVYANLPYIDLAAWRAWIDYPVEIGAGKGRVRAWLGFDGDRLENFVADVGLDHAQARLSRDLPMLALARVSGRLAMRELATGGKALGFLRLGEKQVTGFEVSGQQVSLATPAGVALAPADFSMRTVSARGSKPQEIEMTANSLDLEPVAKLLEHLPVDAHFRKVLGEANPRGAIFDFQLSWRGEFEKPVGYSARGRFSELGMDARGGLPGFANLSGSVVATEKGGTLTLASRNATIQLPEILEDPSLRLDMLTAQLGWTYPEGRFEVRTDNVAFANEDAAGSAQLLYRAGPDSAGYLELSAKLGRARAARVHRYLPKHLVQVRAWLAAAIDKGGVDEALFQVKGNLADFPFDDPKRGNFRATVKVADANLLYASGWPRIEGVRGELVFDRSSMTFRSAAAGAVGQVKLGRVDVRIPDLGGRVHLLDIQGVADGPVQSFLQFIDQSPVDRMIDGFTDGMQATGSGRLSLRITLPVEDVAKTQVAGQFQFTNNDVRLGPEIPGLARVNGVLAFSETGMSLRGIRGDALGGSFMLNGATRGDGSIGISATGNFTAPGLRAWLSDPILAAMSGGASWRAALNVRRGGGDFSVESSLAGLAIDLPSPLGKPAADSVAFRLSKAAVPGTAAEDEVNVTYGRALAARVVRRTERGESRFARGAVGLGDAMPEMPRSGLNLSVSAKSIDVEQWRARLVDPRAAAAPGGATSGLPASSLAEFQPVRATVRAEALDAFGKRLSMVRLEAAQEGSSWNVTVAAQEVNGSLNYMPGPGRDAGRVRARLKHLLIPASAARQDVRDDSPLDRIVQELPALDVIVDAFEVSDKKLGRLEMMASNERGEWRIQRLNLANDDGVLAGSGAWRARRGGEARRRLALDFTLEAYDAGKLLDRLGYPGTVRSGSGRLEGNLAWEGSPLAIDYPSLSGTMALRVEKGQFLKADPGVAKLMGIMSLQALPRRLTLDFRDVFSEGFAFDLVSASSKVERGVLSTSDFKMTGITAAVLMNGEVDLVRETQGLRVVILPDMSGGMGSVVTALLGNPILGLATYLAQRVLKDPLSKAFSYEYVIGGTWADPRIARIQDTQLGQAGQGAGAEAGGARPGATPRADGEGPRQ